VLQRTYWDKEYKFRGRLWRGGSRETEIITSLMVSGLSLDNGCGNGKDTPKAENIIGSDFSRNALRLYPLETKVQSDMRHLPFKDEIFSNVLFLHSLDHLLESDRLIAMREAKRVLRRDGNILIKAFTVRDFRFGKGILVEKDTFRRGNGIVTHYFTTDYFNQLDFLRVKKLNLINYNIIINRKNLPREEVIILLQK
jgi:SAM-dependent methyltransferase